MKEIFLRFNFYVNLTLLCVMFSGCHSHNAVLDYERCGPLFGGKVNVLSAACVYDDEEFNANIRPDLVKFIVGEKDVNFEAEVDRHQQLLVFLNSNDIQSSPNLNKIAGLLELCVRYSKEELELTGQMNMQLASSGYSELMTQGGLLNPSLNKKNMETICSAQEIVHQHYLAFNECYDRFLEEVEPYIEKNFPETSDRQLRFIKGSAKFYRTAQGYECEILSKINRLVSVLLVRMNTFSDTYVDSQGRVVFSSDENLKKIKRIAEQIEVYSKLLKSVEEAQLEGDKVYLSLLGLSPRSGEPNEELGRVAIDYEIQDKLQTALRNYYSTGDDDVFDAAIDRVFDDLTFHAALKQYNSEALTHLLIKRAEEVQKIKDNLEEHLDSYGWNEFQASENIADVGFRTKGKESLQSIIELVDQTLLKLYQHEKECANDINKLFLSTPANTDTFDILFLSYMMDLLHLFNISEYELTKEKAYLYKELFHTMDSFEKPYFYEDGYIYFESDDDLEQYLRIAKQLDAIEQSISEWRESQTNPLNCDYTTFLN